MDIEKFKEMIAKRTQCTGTCMACLPECGVHKIRALRKKREKETKRKDSAGENQ